MSTGFDAASGRALERRGPSSPRALVLLMHGGRPRDPGPVPRLSASVWRMRALRDGVEGALAAEGVGTWLLRYSARGWNDGAPVVDAQWALDLIVREHAGIPVVLLGHSMGARTGIRVAEHRAVVGLVALAPWFDDGDPVRALARRHLVAAHGRRDRITSPRATRRFLERAAPVAASTRFVDMGALGHYLLRGTDRWQQVAASAVLGMVTGR